MYHTLAFTATNAGAVALGDMPGITDSFATLNSSSHYIMGVPSNLKAAYAGGLLMTLAQINTPSLRNVAIPFISPMNIALLPRDQFPMVNFGRNGPLIPSTDELAITYSASAADTDYAVIFVDLGPTPVPQGNTYTVKLTGTTTVTPKVWSPCPLTISSTLPAGNYAVVGMKFESTTAIAGRLIFPGGGPRPGVIGGAGATIDDMLRFRFGNFGLMGTFTSYALPTLDALCNAADAAQTVYLDLIKL